MEFDARKPAYGSMDGAVASACLNKDRRKVLIGTRGSEIYELSTLDEADLNKGPLVTGHCSGSLKAVACHPILGELATVGDDRTLRTWDLASHKQLRSLKLEDGSRALGFLPNGHGIGVGLGSCRWHIRSITSNAQHTAHNGAQRPCLRRRLCALRRE